MLIKCTVAPIVVFLFLASIALNLPILAMILVAFGGFYTAFE